jgi:hypothetical protein
VSVFEGKEAEAFANVLTNGDPGKAAQALSGLAGLPDDVYQATLAQKPVADAVAGMMASKEPGAHDGAMGAADKLWRDQSGRRRGSARRRRDHQAAGMAGLKGAFTVRPNWPSG